MKPVVLATVAVLLYAVMNVVVEQKFVKYPVASLLLCAYAVMLPLAALRWGMLRWNGEINLFPAGALFVLMFVIGVLYFAADYSFLAAYAAGGNVVTVTTILLLTPVFASLLKFLWVGGAPNAYQAVGYLLAIASIYLVEKGSTP